MDELRERFLKVYSNIPLNVRDDIILVIEIDGIQKPITWDVAFVEVKGKTELGTRILGELNRLKFI